MVTLLCALVGVSGSAFAIDIDENKLVSHLKKAITMENWQTITCDDRELRLFLAKSMNGEWLSDDDTLDRVLQSRNVSMYMEMRASWKLSKPSLFGSNVSLGEDVIHVLVVLPGRVEDTGAWSVQSLSSIDSHVQSKLWKSVVRVSVANVCSGTALVVDQTSTHLYLLTNLHLWVDDTFTEHLSTAFTKQIQRYRSCNAQMTTTSGRKRKNTEVAQQPPRRKSPRTGAMTLLDFFNKPKIVVEQFFPDRKRPVKVYYFRLDSDICWRSSAALDFAIFKVAVPRQNELVPCEMPRKVDATMNVDVFGFRSVCHEQEFAHSYDIFPAKITGSSENQMVLSSVAPLDLAGSAIVCTKRGVPMGYLGGGRASSATNGQHQSYAFTFQGVIPELPSSLPRDTERKIKDEQSLAVYSAI